MADLPENSTWETGIYQIETTDPVVGGPPNLALGQGITNVPPQQLANRTIWLRDQITALQAAVGGAATQADIDAAINALIGGAPAALDTLNELAAALADDANYAATITTSLASKLDVTAKAADSDKLDGIDSSGFVRQISNVLTGALGAVVAPTDPGLKDWNATENVKSGISQNLMYGGWSNGPGGTGNFHVMNFEYTGRSGGSNLTQIAIPYRNNSPAEFNHEATCIHYRIRQGGVWSAWMRVLNDGDLNGTMLGRGQTWQDMKPSRVAFTAYQNTGSAPIYVHVRSGIASAWTLSVSADNVAWVDLSEDGFDSIEVIVPPGHYYKTTNIGTAYSWMELR